MAILHISKKQSQPSWTVKINWSEFGEQQPDSARWRQKLNRIAEQHVRALESASDRLELCWIERNYMYFRICWGLAIELNRHRT